MRTRNLKKQLTFKTMAMLLAIQSVSPIYAAHRDYQLCNQTAAKVSGMEVKGTGILLDAKATFKGQDVSNIFKILPDALGLKSTIALEAGDCVSLVVTSKTTGVGLSQYRLTEDAGPFPWQSIDGQDELDATGVMSDIASLHEAQLLNESQLSQNNERLAACLQADASGCDSIKQEVVSGEASAQIYELQKDKKFQILKKLVLPAGMIAATALAAGLISQTKKFKNMLALRRELKNCRAIAGNDCVEFAKQTNAMVEELQKIDQKLKKDWHEFAVNDVQSIDENANASAVVRIPEYLRGDAPLGNEQISILARLENVQARDVKKIELSVAGKKIPATYFPASGLLRADVKGLPASGVNKASIVIWGKNGVIGEESFSFKKDSTKPQVIITQKGKNFEVKVRDQGLGFNQLKFTGSNVSIEQSEVNFEKPVMEYNKKLKVTGNPASLHVVANKSVVIQKVKDLNGEELAATSNENGNLQYPEEIAPRTDMVDEAAINQALAGGKRLRGKCCRDSSCVFCHDDNLYDCRVKGFGHWKFNDGDPFCYKIKPL